MNTRTSDSQPVVAWQNAVATIIIVFVAFLLCLAVWRLFWVTKVERHELGFAFNKLSGKIEVFEEQGWVSRNPFWYDVHTIDLRPQQVSISANSRVLNAKLVRFNPKGLDTFIQWHGRNAGQGRSGQSESPIYEILKSYAFDVDNGADCPFLIIDNELRRSAPAAPEGSAKK